MTLTAEYLADHAQNAFDDACPEDASQYEVGKAWRKVGEHLAAVIAEAAEDRASALEPFQALAREVTSPGADRDWLKSANDWMVVFSFAGVSVTLGHLRALAALEPAGSDAREIRNADA